MLGFPVNPQKVFLKHVILAMIKLSHYVEESFHPSLLEEGVKDRSVNKLCENCSSKH